MEYDLTRYIRMKYRINGNYEKFCAEDLKDSKDFGIS